MADTEVLEQPVTAAPVAEAPPPAAPEAVTTETDALQPTETGGAPEPKRIEYHSDDELLSNDVVKGILAREKESARLSEEARQSRQFRQQATQYAPQAAAYIAGEVKRATETGAEVNQQGIANALAWFREGEKVLQYRAHRQALMEFMPPTDAAAFEALETRYEAGRINEEEFWKDASDLGFKARLQKEMPELRKQFMADQQKSQAATAQAETVISNDQRAREEPRPTSGGGAPANSYNTRDEAALAFNQGRIDATTYKRLRDALS